MKLVELKEFLTRNEAEMTLDMLSHQGFNVFLQSDDMAGQNPSLGLVSGYQLMIDKEQLEEAKDFLNSAE